ncbi:sugar ABC transporter permease [Streptomyces sp. WMMC500]|uniref:carbohydrate ABC transporter permease n=1 Tax=Streptomyces sp. WMMC500 TaxID=3015154 RepID=UPI00248CF49D|nr:sugar ABC transporter permease [Streptomyces sp. WMMC500]WBB60574.1 sugar ABC transporter permease [Streptomyces sp. WMMC500]
MTATDTASVRDRGAPAAPRSRTARARRRRRLTERQSKAVAFVVLTAPMLLGLGLFRYIAIGWSFLLSFSEARRSIALGNWVGLDNYRLLLEDERFRESLTMIVVFTAFIVPLTFAASLGLAVLVNRVRRGRAFFRTAFLLPAAVSYVAAALVWKMALFSGVPAGLANTVGALFGADPTPWIQTQSPPLYWIVLVTLRLWLQVGLYMILFIAGLQAIPRHLYEAAALDGAGAWRTFRSITLPMLRNTSVAVLLLMLIAALQAFDEFYAIFATGASLGSEPVRTPLVHLYGVALQDQNYGVGSAGAFLLTLLIVVVTLLQGRLLGFARDKD